jgi:hypothetical protein
MPRVCCIGVQSDKLLPSGDHGSKYRVEVIGPGRRDWFSEPQSCFRSADLICGAAHLSLTPSSSIGGQVGLSWAMLAP